MSYECHVVLDFEFNPTAKECRRYLRSEIIEIGAVKLNDRMEEIGRFSCLVQPEFNCYVEPDITKLTGIRTEDLMHAVRFEEALRLFSDWVGQERTRVYSWSDNDLRQLLWECDVKEVAFPASFGRWMDLQKVFQRLIHYPRRQCMGLNAAMNMMGIPFDGEKAHRAMYDADLTAELLRLVKSEDFIPKQREARKTFLTDTSRSTYTLGSACGDKLAALLAEMSVA